MKSNMIKRLQLVAAATLMLGASAVTQATPVIYDFTNTDVGAYGAGPFGTVTLTEVAGGAVTFSVALRSDMNFINTGGFHSIFSFNSIGVDAADISSILFGGLPDTRVIVSTPGANQPFGKTFSLMLDCPDNVCATGANFGQFTDPLTFTVANAHYSDFGFMATGTNAYFASDVVCVTGACSGESGAIGVVQGRGVGSQGDPLPEPISVSLFALGLLGLAAARRRRS